MTQNIVIVGGSGAIGGAFARQLSVNNPKAIINVFSRHRSQHTVPGTRYHAIEYTDETTMAESALVVSKDTPIDMVIVATGMLHNDDIMPEKSLGDVSAKKFQRLFAVNTVIPALVAKHFLPRMRGKNRVVFAALSARVGSISDNRLGGWYAYRASKAALNMIIKNAAIEMGRRNRQAIIVGLHPGTVDSHLSSPFQSNVPDGKLFTPEYSAQKLLEVLANLKPEQSGKCFGWDGAEIQP